MIAFSSLLLVVSIAAGLVLVARTRILTVPGAVGAGILALLLTAAGGLAGLVPALAFFLLSSLWTLWPGGSRGRDRTRTLSQVLANGGVAAILALGMLLFRSTDWLIVPLCGSFAAAAADTWATEWGKSFGGRPLSLRTFRKAEPGESGAISLVGTLASVAGAASVAYSSLLAGLLDDRQALIVLAAGTAGALVDSVSGAWVQAIWLSSDGRRVEIRPQSDPQAKRLQGIAWVDNNVVNLIATLTGTLAAWVLAS